MGGDGISGGFRGRMVVLVKSPGIRVDDGSLDSQMFTPDKRGSKNPDDSTKCSLSGEPNNEWNLWSNKFQSIDFLLIKGDN